MGHSTFRTNSRRATILGCCSSIRSDDNASLPLPFAGPTTAFNNSYISSQLDVVVESGPSGATSPVLESTSPMSIHVDAYYLDEAQQPIAIENANLELTMTYGDDEFVLNGQTDSSGQWTPIDVDDLHDVLIPQTLLDYSATSQGQVDIVVDMQSIELPNTQPFASATAQSSMGTGITVQLAGPSSVDMDANSAIDINVTLSAVEQNPAHQASLEGTTIHWQAFDDSSQVALMEGNETISSGKIRIVSTFENMTKIEFMVDSGDRQMFGTTMIGVQLNAYSVPVQENETDNQTEEVWAPTSIESVTIGCESSIILTNQQNADDSIECVITNPNPFAVNVVVSVTSSPSLFKTPGTVSIAANASETVAFDPKYEDPLWARQKDVDVEKEFTIQLRTSSPVYDLVDQYNDDTVTWTASLHVEEPTSDGEEKSSSNTALYGGIGAVVVILAIAGYVILNRRASAAFEDESFYEEDDFIEEEEEPIEIPEGKPLDEFEDKTIADEPEVIERPGDALISEVDDSGDNADEEVSEEIETAVEETSEEDDGISVDEYGTEWYEDEVGTWWYREEGAEDWSEYHE